MMRGTEIVACVFVTTSFVLNPANGPFSAFAWIKGGGPEQAIISQTDGAGFGRTWLRVDASGRFMTELTDGGRFTPYLAKGGAGVSSDAVGIIALAPTILYTRTPATVSITAVKNAGRTPIVIPVSIWFRVNASTPLQVFDGATDGSGFVDFKDFTLLADSWCDACPQ